MTQSLTPYLIYTSIEYAVNFSLSHSTRPDSFGILLVPTNQTAVECNRNYNHKKKKMQIFEERDLWKKSYKIAADRLEAAHVRKRFGRPRFSLHIINEEDIFGSFSKFLNKRKLS